VTRFQAIIFDLDGVLLDSEQVAIDVSCLAAEKAGYSIPRDFWLSTVGHAAEQIRLLFPATFGGPDAFDELQVVIDALYVTRVTELGPGIVRSGVRDLLAELAARSVPCAVATSSHRSWAESCLRTSELRPNFKVVVGRDDAGAPKPNPGVFRLAASRLGIAPEACIVLEDSETGISAAASAGMHSILVPDLQPPSFTARRQAQAVFASIPAAIPYVISLLSTADTITENYPKQCLSVA
jgi:HAD superfamily hydrolase (TIGR01509 family)